MFWLILEEVSIPEQSSSKWGQCSENLPVQPMTTLDDIFKEACIIDEASLKSLGAYQKLWLTSLE